MDPFFYLTLLLPYMVEKLTKRKKWNCVQQSCSRKKAVYVFWWKFEEKIYIIKRTFVFPRISRGVSI